MTVKGGKSMANFNKVILLGNLTRDPQLRYLPNQTAVVDIGMAVNRRWKGPQGEDREEVVFVDCSAFGRQAEVINQYCQKGKPLFIEGRLKLDQWEDKNGGGKRSRLTVVIESFQLLGGPNQGGPGGGGEYDQAPQQQPQRQPYRKPVAQQPQQPPRPGNDMPDPPISEDQHFKPDDIPF
jgi:single-strand DNA-binding protein